MPTGILYQVEDISNPEDTFRMAADELGRQYSLGYYPKQSVSGEKRQVRQIKVKVNQPNPAVRARSSYIVGSKNINFALITS